MVVGNTLTVAVGNGSTFKVTLLGVVFTQLGVPDEVTLTMLIIVLVENVLLIVAVPEALKVIV